MENFELEYRDISKIIIILGPCSTIWIPVLGSRSIIFLLNSRELSIEALMKEFKLAVLGNLSMKDGICHSY